MKTCILDALFVSQSEVLFNGKSALDHILPKIKLADFDRLILLQTGLIKNVPDGVKNVVLSDPTPVTVLETIEKEARQAETIAVVNAGSPLYDPEFMQYILTRHDQYVADFTTGLGFPTGLVPSVIRKDILKEMIQLVSDDDDLTRDYLFEAISKDINAFDIETILSKQDLRLFRLSFGTCDVGETEITDRIFQEIGGEASVEDMVAYLAEHKDSFYSTIYMTTIELTNILPTGASFLPVPDGDNFISSALVFDILPQLQNINRDMHIVLGGNGEPVRHPDFARIIAAFTKAGFPVIVETFANFDQTLITEWSSFDRDMIWFVVSLDAATDETYQKLHPSGSFKKAGALFNALEQAGFRTFRKVTRLEENELEIEKFIRDGDTDNLIIRKYSSFCNTLPDRVVVDLSPLKRIPCFHLRRELFIAVDGTVPICNYCRQLKLGDADNEKISSIIHQVQQAYERNSREDYETCCLECDDYYIFNF